MEAREWIIVLVAAFTLVSSWCQFWVKERLFSRTNESRDPVISALKGKRGILFIAVTGIVSVIAMLLLALEVFSSAPLTRIDVFNISALSIIAFLNIVIIHSLYTLRKLAAIKDYIDQSNASQRLLTLFINR